jgi:hypothetical protein
MKPPDHARLRGFEIRRSQHRTAVDEIGDGVEPVDRKPAETVDDHPFGGGGMGRVSWNQRAARRRYRDQGNSEAETGRSELAISFLPLCRHS